jgi:hypothetical protein
VNRKRPVAGAVTVAVLVLGAGGIAYATGGDTPTRRPWVFADERTLTGL